MYQKLVTKQSKPHPDAFWASYEVVAFGVVAVYGVVSFFFIHDSLALFRVANVVVALANVAAIRKAARERSSGYSALLVSALFFALSFALKYPVRFE